jgi:hypothetical protein
MRPSRVIDSAVTRPFTTSSIAASRVAKTSLLRPANASWCA